MSSEAKYKLYAKVRCLIIWLSSVLSHFNGLQRKEKIVTCTMSISCARGPADDAQSFFVVGFRALVFVTLNTPSNSNSA